MRNSYEQSHSVVWATWLPILFMKSLRILVPGLVALLSLHSARADFGPRWEEIKHAAKPAELYTVLYGLPKGGDLHNHMTGAFLPEQWYRAATDPNLKGRANYYIRIHHPAITAADLEPSYPFETIRESSWQALPLAAR